jgi:uroporphyrinogen-III synthase
MHVVVTRPAQEGQRWVRQLTERGHAAIALPLLAIGPAPDPTALAQARDALPRMQAVMFVSANAVHGLLDPPLAWPEAVRAWAPGPGTRQALLEAGVPAAQVDAPDADAAQFDSERLWEVVRGQVRAGHRVLIVRGADAAGREQGREWLGEQLAAAGAQVATVAAYARAAPTWSAVQVEQARAAAVDGSWWLFSSSEAAANLGRLLPGQSWAAARAVATHHRIAQAVRALGFGNIRMARPAFADVVASIESAG